MKKKFIIFSSSLCLFIFGIYLGTIYHAQIFSFFDEIDEINEKNDPIPEGFDILPDNAKFIFNDLLKNSWHWGWGGGDISPVFADSESYYILGHKSHPHDAPVCSYYAKLYGTRINGKDGSVYDRTLEKWEKIGYIPTTKDELVQKIQVGSKENEVLNIIGDGFETGDNTYQHPLHISETEADLVKNMGGDINDVKGVHYWCRDGEVIIIYLKDEVIKIITKMNFTRI